MSIYHCSIKIIGRGGGRSAVSAAAYRSGEKLYSEETGITHDYTHKGGVIMSEIILPDGAPSRLSNREILWNEVQQIEKRVDAQLAREIEVALPSELTRAEQIECVRGFIKENFTSKGMIADWALHDKGDGNPHAHILLTVREVREDEGWQVKQKSVFANARDENGKPVYNPSLPSYDPKDKENTSMYRIPAIDENGNQKTRIREGKGTEYLWERISIPANDWNEHDKCEQWRKSWADHCNEYLPAELHIDHRSYERQGLDIEPTIHEGITARKMEMDGKVSDRCEMNRDIRHRNLLKEKIAEQFNELSTYIISKARNLYERVTGIFTKEKSRRADRAAKEAGRDDISYGGTTVGEQRTGEVRASINGQDQIIRDGTIRSEDGDPGKRRRTGRADGIKQQLEQRERETAITDKNIRETDSRIDELTRIKNDKERGINDRIRKLMEHRGTCDTDGGDAIRDQQSEIGETDLDSTKTVPSVGERRPDDVKQTAGGTDTAALIRDIESAISSARTEEGIADKERADREAKERRLSLERERAAERDRQEARERALRDQKKKRRDDFSL